MLLQDAQRYLRLEELVKALVPQLELLETQELHGLLVELLDLAVVDVHVEAGPVNFLEVVVALDDLDSLQFLGELLAQLRPGRKRPHETRVQLDQHEVQLLELMHLVDALANTVVQSVHLLQTLSQDWQLRSGFAQLDVQRLVVLQDL